MKNNAPSFNVERRGDVVIVTFIPDVLDPLIVEELKHELPRLVEAPETKKLVMDFTKVAYFPSRLLGVLLDVNQAVERHGGQLRLCGIRPMILDVFKFMRLDTVLKIHKDTAEAMGSF